MKAKIEVRLKTASAEEAHRLLNTICEGLMASGSIDDFGFEIETDDGGLITQKCILSDGKVIA